LNIKSLFCTDQSRTSVPARVKKMATAGSAATKKNISIVKEENEDASGEVKKFFEFFSFIFLNHKYKIHIIHKYPTGSTRIFNYTIRFHCKSKQFYVIYICMSISLLLFYILLFEFVIKNKKN